MSSLIIKSKIGLEGYYDNPKNLPSAFVLDALPKYYTDNLEVLPTTKLTFDKSEELYNGNHTTVFRGELAAEDGSMAPLDVVIKIDIHRPHAKSLVREAEFYTKKLNDLQGLVIPLYYGIYQATFDSRKVTCLLLQYCGKPVKRIFSKLDKKYKLEIVNRLGYIHHLGVAHGDVREANVLDYNGVPFIVDFEDARDHHCCRSMQMVWGALKPYSSEFNCDELYNVGVDIGLWMTSAFWFHGALVVVRKLKSAEQLVEMVPDRLKTTEAARHRLLKEAHGVIKSLANHSQFHPDVQHPKPLLSSPLSPPPSPLSSDPSHDAGISE